MILDQAETPNGIPFSPILIMKKEILCKFKTKGRYIETKERLKEWLQKLTTVFEVQLKLLEEWVLGFNLMAGMQEKNNCFYGRVWKKIVRRQHSTIPREKYVDSTSSNHDDKTSETTEENNHRETRLQTQVQIRYLYL